MPNRKKKNVPDAHLLKPIKSRMKRRPKYLTLQDKISVIHHYEHIGNTRKLAKVYDVCRGQIKSILWNKERYLAEWHGSADSKKSNMRYIARKAILGAIVHQWVQRARSEGNSVDDIKIRQIARQAGHLINFREHRPTALWVQLFKKKYNLQNLDPIESTGSKKSKNLSKIFFGLGEIIPDRRFKDFSTKIAHQLQLVALEMKKIKRRKYQDGYGTSSTESATEDEDVVVKPDEDVDIKSDEEDIDIKSDEEDIDVKPDEENINTKPDEEDVDNNQEVDVQSDEEDVDVKPDIGVDELTEGRINEDNILKPIISYREALDYLGHLESFVLAKEDFRVVGLIDQLQNLFLEEINNSK